jgi:hypothetical protein
MAKEIFGVLAVFTLCFMHGCSAMPSDALLGKDRDLVLRVLGKPLVEKMENEAVKLVYPKGPYGKGTFFIELDVSGRVVSWRDVLTYENFNKIKIGMLIQEVEEIIGPSLWRWEVAKDRQTIHNYPFDNSMCQIFQVAVLPSGLIAEHGFGFAPECEHFGDS